MARVGSRDGAAGEPGSGSTSSGIGQPTAERYCSVEAGSNPLHGLRFHDLRHQAITELSEAGVTDATLMAVSGHMSRRMLEHYSHGRMAAKRTVLDQLESGLMGTLGNGPRGIRAGKLKGLRHEAPLEMNGGRDRTRTCDLLRVKQAL